MFRTIVFLARLCNATTCRCLKQHKIVFSCIRKNARHCKHRRFLKENEIIALECFQVFWKTHATASTGVFLGKKHAVLKQLKSAFSGIRENARHCMHRRFVKARWNNCGSNHTADPSKKRTPLQAQALSKNNGAETLATAVNCREAVCEPQLNSIRKTHATASTGVFWEHRISRVRHSAASTRIGILKHRIADSHF